MAKIINNKTSIIFTICFSFIIIIALTIYKVNQEHLRRSFLDVEKRIIEGAKECVWNGACNENEITLGDLINLGYAKEEVNPETKMYYSHDSIIKKNGEDYVFESVN